VQTQIYIINGISKKNEFLPCLLVNISLVANLSIVIHLAPMVGLLPTFPLSLALVTFSCKSYTTFVIDHFVTVNCWSLFLPLTKIVVTDYCCPANIYTLSDIAQFLLTYPSHLSRCHWSLIFYKSYTLSDIAQFLLTYPSHLSRCHWSLIFYKSYTLSDIVQFLLIYPSHLIRCHWSLIFYKSYTVFLHCSPVPLISVVVTDQFILQIRHRFWHLITFLFHRYNPR
jgi:hypothetical protein